MENPVDRKAVDIQRIIDNFDVKEMAHKWEEIYDA